MRGSVPVVNTVYYNKEKHLQGTPRRQSIMAMTRPLSLTGPLVLISQQELVHTMSPTGNNPPHPHMWLQKRSKRPITSLAL